MNVERMVVALNRNHEIPVLGKAPLSFGTRDRVSNKVSLVRAGLREPLAVAMTPHHHRGVVQNPLFGRVRQHARTLRIGRHELAGAARFGVRRQVELGVDAHRVRERRDEHAHALVRAPGQVLELRVSLGIGLGDLDAGKVCAAGARVADHAAAMVAGPCPRQAGLVGRNAKLVFAHRLQQRRHRRQVSIEALDIEFAALHGFAIDMHVGDDRVE